MVAQTGRGQRIARLTPLTDVLSLIGKLAHPVAPRQMPLADAFALTLAEDVVAALARPSVALALRDGWAVQAEAIADAGAYAPVPLPKLPPWLEVGEPLPTGADAVAPLDAIVEHGTSAEAIAVVTPGDNVLPSGADVAAGSVLCGAGHRLRYTDVAALAAAGIDRVSVRVPRIRITSARRDAGLETIVGMLAGMIAGAGAIASTDGECDVEIFVGGTGSGRRDDSVNALARRGHVAVHGVALSPGETAALGEAEGHPVLLIPGRIDAALAVWLVVGRPLLTRLRGGRLAENGVEVVLSRKVTSRLGLAETILVRRSGDGVVPIASDYLSLTALTGADGWILVPAESEGYPAGARVTVRPLP